LIFVATIARTATKRDRESKRVRERERGSSSDASIKQSKETSSDPNNEIS